MNAALGRPRASAAGPCVGSFLPFWLLRLKKFSCRVSCLLSGHILYSTAVCALAMQRPWPLLHLYLVPVCSRVDGLVAVDAIFCMVDNIIDMLVNEPCHRASSQADLALVCLA